jgi:glucose-1-phosphate thymidylyltransferase
MKGIVLAGGSGSRLWPITLGVSKQLLAVYDKPLVHYPISVLMLAGIREILVISTPNDKANFQRLLGDGSQYGVKFDYAVQQKPEGLAQAFLIGEPFIKGNKCCLILGDNIFYGQGLGTRLNLLTSVSGANIFAYKVKDPHRYGVVEFDKDHKVLTLEEKPSCPKSNYAVPGLYFYDERVVEVAKEVKPSRRGELEITSINQFYLEEGLLEVTVLERGTAWLDTGTFESMNDASNYIRILEERQGVKVSCLEEISWRNGWITDSELMRTAQSYGTSPYSEYLKGLLIK